MSQNPKNFKQIYDTAKGNASTLDEKYLTIAVQDLKYTIFECRAILLAYDDELAERIVKRHSIKTERLDSIGE